MEKVLLGCSSLLSVFLGVSTFLRPDKTFKLKRQTRNYQYVPYRLIFFDKYMLTVQHIGTGYGYTVFVCQPKDEKGQIIYGTGVNTDNQLGYHEYPRKSGNNYIQMSDKEFLSKAHCYFQLKCYNDREKRWRFQN